VTDYKRMTIRLPDEVRAALEAAAGTLKRPEWRVIVDAILADVGAGPGLTDDERRVVRAVVKLHENG
jgi:predicted transcriptional regulator